MNKVILYGNLTRDPELRALPSGGQVCSFGLATNRVWRDKEGNKQEAAEFHNIVVFGRQAETCAQYLKKGSSSIIEGRIQTRSWESPEKGKQYRTEIIADRVEFGSRSSGSAGGATPQAQSDAEAPQRAPKEEGIDYPQEDINPDDIPF
ncbi:MAG: single-strand DNA-binding protein [Parcubacteria group bacterium Gr01-1014_56]|nr:MAG: single-strand DNA-binding protein [Parcubacteria group bacterium Gr01-1014_56]